MLFLFLRCGKEKWDSEKLSNFFEVNDGEIGGVRIVIEFF